MKKRGQVTVFIILGLVLLFTFIFIFQLAKKVQIEPLASEQERMVKKVFQKEGLRVYIDDCLTDALEEGLELIGRQGTIWKEQGGRSNFISGTTGTSYFGEENIFYGITKKNHFPDNQYPCRKGPPPVFCNYSYPNGSIELDYIVKFGELKLTEEAIEDDLRAFLIDQTIKCVSAFINKKVSPTAKISTKNIVLDLELLQEGIKIKVDYPLTLRLGSQEAFQLVKFDFFYPSEFKKLLEAAILRPLKYDSDFVDFDYADEKTLEARVFTKGKGTSQSKDYPMGGNEYRELGIKTFSKIGWAGGDDIFEFKLLQNKILKEGLPSEDYLLRFARQNRQPALDYIGREACEEEGYDYLAIIDDEGLGAIDISLSAKDPDEDEVSYSFSDSEPRGLVDKNEEENKFYFEPEASGGYSLTAQAKDEHGLGDQQVVRILVDRPMKTEISLELPYPGINYYSEGLGGVYILSNEDPVFIKASWPEESLTESRPAPNAVSLKYTGEGETFYYSLPDPLIITESGSCFSLPNFGLNRCDIDSYTKEDLEKWKDRLNDVSKDYHFRSLTREAGKLNLTFSINYCNKNQQASFKEVKVRVEQCIPYRDPTHPWGYPYHQYTYNTKIEEGKTKTDFNSYKRLDPDINPFLATHTCCGNNWEIYKKEEDIKCFINPTIGCYGKSEVGFTTIYQNYLLEEEYATCDGMRGNICGGEKQYRLWQDKPICGSNDQLGCSNIAEVCQKKEAWSYIFDENGNRGICAGKMGCEKFYYQPEKAMIDVLGQTSSSRFFDISQRAKGQKAADFNEFAFGCSGHESKHCDDNFDGVFDKTCQQGVCQ